MNFSTFANQMVQLLGVSFLKTSAVLLIALVLARLLRFHAASLRHWLLNLTLMATLLLPVLSIVSPVWSLAILPSRASSSSGLIDRTAIFPMPKSIDETVVKGDAPISKPPSQSAPNQPANVVKMPPPAAPPLAISPDAPHLSGAVVLLFIWLSGAALVLLRWLYQFRLISGVTRRASTADSEWNRLLGDQARLLNIRRRVRLVVSAEIHIPMTWGLLRPIIVLPVEAEAWDVSRRGVVLRHELAHVARWDYLTQWILLLSCTINWFNPLIWRAARQITLEREQASDDLVLNSGVHGIEYAAHLLDIARGALAQRSFQMVGLAMAQRSDLEQRIRGILNKSQRRSTPRLIRLLIFAAVAAVLLPLGGMRLSQAQASGITLSLAIPQGAAEGVRDQGLLDDFLTAHPGVTINFVDAQQPRDAAGDVDGYFSALQKYTSTADVLYFSGDNLGLSPLATRAGYLLDLAPLIQSDPEALQDDFYPQLWDSFQWDGGMWALPFGAEMALLVYNKSAFDQAGLTYPDGTWTLDQWVSAANALTVRDANGNVINCGFINSGRIFREAFWRSQLTSDLMDTSSQPNTPQFNRPDVTAVMDAYTQVEQQDVWNCDQSAAAMYVDAVGKQPMAGDAWALLPGGHGVLLPDGFAVSAGTQQPELAYDLVKYLTGISGIAQPIPARKSTTPAGGIASFVAQPYQALIQQAFDNSLTLSNLRLTDYLNQYVEQASADNILAAQTQADNDLQAADARRATLTLTVSEPVAPTLPPGKIALNFDVIGDPVVTANQDAWNHVVQDFTANDPQVGLVNLRRVQEPVSAAAQDSDCFYMSDNAVPSVSDNSLLDLGPLMSADPNFDPNDFVSGVLASVQRGDQTLALPMDIEPFVLRYSPDQFSAANLPDPSNDWTVSDFADALNALKAVTQGQAPLVDSNTNGAYLLLLIASYGGLPLDFRSTPPTINFTDPATVDAIRQVLDLARSGAIRYTALGDFGQTTPANPTPATALYPALLNSFVRKILPGQTPDQPVLFPRGQQYNGVAYTLGTAYISAQSQSPDACYRFISTLAQHPELFSAMPARRSLLTDPTFTASTDPNVLALYNALAARLQDPNTIAFDGAAKNVALTTNYLDEHWLFQAFDSYVLDNGDLASALQDAQTYATAFQTCAANLPPLISTSGDVSAVMPYVNCAEQADNSIKPFLDPMVAR